MTDDSELYRQKILNKVNQDPIHRDSDVEMWEQLVDRISEIESRKKSPYVWYAAAAAILICLTAAWYFYRMHYYPSGTGMTEKVTAARKLPEVQSHQRKEVSGNPDTTEAPSQGNVFRKEYAAPDKKAISVYTSGNEIKHYKLPEGSGITLNKDTRLKVEEIISSQIKVQLTGEAYFEVAPDKKRAFLVYFGSSFLKVVGTRFNVRNIEGEKYQEICVTEGTVHVYTKGDPSGIDVKAGGLLKIDTKEGTYTLHQVSPLPFVSWKTGNLVFKASPLEEVAEILGRNFKTKIVTADTVKRCVFTGDLSQMSLEEALQIIQVTVAVDIKRNKDNVYISGAGCD